MNETEYRLEVAMARHDGIIRRCKTAINLVMGRPTPGNRHLDQAVTDMLKDDFQRLDANVKLLEDLTMEVVAEAEARGETYYRPPSEANRRKAEELSELYEGFQSQSRRRFGDQNRYSGRSVSLALTLYPLVMKEAVDELHSEIISRDRTDPVREAYIEAMIEAADLVPKLRETLVTVGRWTEGRPPEAELTQALEAADRMDAITGPYRSEPSPT